MQVPNVRRGEASSVAAGGRSGDLAAHETSRGARRRSPSATGREALSHHRGSRAVAATREALRVKPPRGAHRSLPGSPPAAADRRRKSDDGRSVPEPHQPDSRSFANALRSSPFGSKARRKSPPGQPAGGPALHLAEVLVDEIAGFDRNETSDRHPRVGHQDFLA